MTYLLHNLLRFGRVLRGLGLDVQAGGMLNVAHALEYINVGRREEFRTALRSLLVHRAGDLPVFDEAFNMFWRRRGGPRTQLDLRAVGEERRFGAPEVDLASLGVGGDEPDDREAPRWGRSGSSWRPIVLGIPWREKDFAKLTSDELQQATRIMAELEWELGLRRTQRWRTGRGPRLDLRRVIRATVAHGAEPVELPRRERMVRRRPLVLICDVSGSMERYTRMLLTFIMCLTSDLDRVEAFLFATRLTRITPHVRRRRLHRVLETLAGRVPDWSGGTRIGEALRAFNVRWARRILGHGPVVLLISDGWDRGDPALLRREIARLQRSCRTLIWLNPLLGSSRYEPSHGGCRPPCRSWMISCRFTTWRVSRTWLRTSTRCRRRGPHGGSIRPWLACRRFSCHGVEGNLHVRGRARASVRRDDRHPDVVAACLPGCEVFEPVGDGDTLRYRVVMTIGIAAMTGRYEGRVEIVDVDRPHGYTITVEGRAARPDR